MKDIRNNCEDNRAPHEHIMKISASSKQSRRKESDLYICSDSKSLLEDWNRVLGIFKVKELPTPEPSNMSLSTDEEIVSSTPSKMVGWLRKEGHFIKSWKDRYFVLLDGTLKYYVSSKEDPPYGETEKGSFELKGSTINYPYNNSAIVIKLCGKMKSTALLVHSQNEMDAVSWATSIRQHIAFANAGSGSTEVVAT